jgi:hypothetical protein
MSNPIENTVITKGLPSIVSSENSDFQLWKDRNRDKFIEYGVSMDQAKSIYMDKMFIDKFGREEYDRLIDNGVGSVQRNNLYESTLVNEYLQDNYSEDPRFGEISMLTLRGKRDLINNTDYLTPIGLEEAKERERKRAEDAIKEDTDDFSITNALNNLRTVNYSGMSYGVHETVVSNSNIKFLDSKQDKTLDSIIEQDKKYMIEDTEVEYNTILGDYMKMDEELRASTVEEEFERIASGWDEIIETPEGTTTVHIPGSNYYNVFKDDELEGMSTAYKMELLCRYKAIAQKYGHNQAIYYLDSTLQNKIADQQGFWETLGTSIYQTIFTGVIPNLINGVASIPALFMSDEDAADYLNSDFIQYLDKVAKYDTWDTDLQDEAEANGGISQTKIVWTKDQQNAWLSNKTFADVLEQSEFIIEMAATSYLTGGIGGAAAKGLSLTSKAAKATNLISKSQRALSAVDKAEDLLTATGRLTKMAADAVPVASLEARGVFNDTRDANLAQIESRLEEQATNDALIQLDTPYAQQNIEKMIDSMVANFEEQYPDLKFKTNREAFREQAEQQYLTYLIDVNKEILSSSFDSDREVASEKAADAFKTTFIASTVKTAAVNYGFRSILNTLPFRKAIKAQTPKVQSRINSEGLLETELMSNFSKYGWPIIKNTFGEGLDEVADELIAAYGTGSGTGKFSAYMSNKYEGTDISEFVAGLSGGTTSTYNALFDENTWKAGLIGAISPLGMVTPNFHASEVKPINGKSYTALEWINKYVSNELIHDIVENKAVEAETIRRNEHINEILRGYSSTFQDINAVLNSVGGMNAALYTGNAEHAISAKHDASVNLMMTLEHLSSDDIVGTSKILQNVKTILERAAKGEITEAEVDEFVNSPNNRGINISREEARVEIQENAQKLLNIQKKIVDTKERLSKNTNFQSMDAATQDALVKNTLKIENAKERIASIRENLGLTSNPSETVVAGSIEDINEQINALSRQVFFLRDERYRLNDSKEFHRDTDPKTKSAIKKHVKNIEKTISKLDKRRRALESLEVDENGYTRVLSAEEIKSLDNISLEHILDPSNSTLFSEEQREQIDKVKEELNKKIADSDMPMSVGEDAAHTYASTLGSLYESSTTAERMNDAVLIEGLDGKAVRTMYNDLLGIRTASNIENKSRRQFDPSIEFHIYTPEGKVIQEPEEIQKLIESLCTKYDHTIIGDYINRNERKLPVHIREALYKALEKSEILENMKDAATDAHINVNQDIAKNIADTLQSIAIDPNVNSIEDALDVLQNIIADDNLDIQFRRALAAIIEELGGIVDNEKLKEKLETPIIPDSSEGQSAPPKPVEPEVKLTPEEEKKIEPEVPKVKPTDIQRGDVNPNAENEIITFALNLANGINGYTKETRQRVEGIINNASPYCTKEELAEYLLEEANRLDSQSSEENDSYASSLLRQCASKVANRKDPNESPQEEKRRETLNVFEKNKSRASNIESLNMDQIVRDYPNSPNTKFYEKYKVREFLESNQISNRTPVVFISDPSFVEEVEESMRSNGANPTVYSLPLVAAVEVESGGIEIDGKYYQPIAIMPATDSQTKRGASRLGDVRTRAYKQKDSGKVELVKDEEGDVITTTIYGNVNAEPPIQIKPELPNKSANTLLINDASESDRRELQNLSKADRRKSPIYQRIKSAFLSKLSHRKTEKGEELVYRVPNLKGNEEIPIIALVTSSHKTVDRNSDELIIDLVKRGDKSALKSNSRIIRYTKALNKFFSETFNTSEFSFEQDDKGNVVPSESTKKALDNYATQLDNILSNFLNLPSRSGWKYKIESTGRVVDGKIEYNLSIQDSYDNIINLATLTEGKIGEDTQLEVIRNLMVDSNTGEARMRDSKYGFVVWNVVFTDAGNISEGAKNNMADIFDDDIIEFSKESLKYTIKGVTLNAPFSGLGEPLYKKGNQGTSVDDTNNTNTENEGDSGVVDTPIENNSVSDVVDSVSDANTPSVEIDPDTGAVIGGNVQTESVQEQAAEVESKPIEMPTPGKVRNRFEDNLDSEAQPKTVSPKYQWGVFEGAKMSVDEITDALIDQDIYTEEDWNNLSEQEKDRVLKCCGAL